MELLLSIITSFSSYIHPSLLQLFLVNPWKKNTIYYYIPYSSLPDAIQHASCQHQPAWCLYCDFLNCTFIHYVYMQMQMQQRYECRLRWIPALYKTVMEVSRPGLVSRPDFMGLGLVSSLKGLGIVSAFPPHPLAQPTVIFLGFFTSILVSMYFKTISYRQS